MDQANETPRKKRNLWARFLVVVNILLCIALAVGFFTIWMMERNRTQQAVSQNFLLEQQLAEAQEKIEHLEKNTIPVETFQEYALQFNPNTEFIQKFFPDRLVYKDETGIVYAEIDPSLGLHSYDWSGLSRKNGRISYRPENGPHGIPGVDVSKHQGEIDWQKVKEDGFEFAMIRAVYRGYGDSGKLMQDEKFDENLDGVLAAGMDAGVYVFSQAITVEEAIEEAKLAIEMIDGRKIVYPVVFDMEEIAGGGRTDRLSPQEVTDIAIAFCNTVKQAGYEPMIYGNVKWLIKCMQPERLTQYDIWLAQYYRTPAFPYHFRMWQYSSVGKVDGIKGNTDLNLFFGK